MFSKMIKRMNFPINVQLYIYIIQSQYCFKSLIYFILLIEISNMTDIRWSVMNKDLTYLLPLKFLG